ncbi:hypothetical protein E2C01_088080 [Portunus trituberculatus]|uniref:Uncharacterized protein n=1 Tax=Portunus trituberculatus TaxID=210409 RepID=A0A5B7JL01_PORTR|nr:hypothetical protein [Portunus trituberculatus]
MNEVRTQYQRVQGTSTDLAIPHSSLTCVSPASYRTKSTTCSPSSRSTSPTVRLGSLRNSWCNIRVSSSGFSALGSPSSPMAFGFMPAEFEVKECE